MTTHQILANPPRRKRGGQPGNSNARTQGHHTAIMRARRARLTLLKRKVRLAIALVSAASSSQNAME